ncbi:MAG: 7-carboxy-7-deazaguanine synthase QueE [Planctomycetes bacterium]|nr:7-carboxy-7-deazaguanine synthase QueE [Planctomycetota bacterium]
MVQKTPGYLSEVFCSIQGEAALAGKPQLFLRFNYCGLKCAYCDTSAKIAPGKFVRIEKSPACMDFRNVPNPITAQTLFMHVKKITGTFNSCHSISVTGGEPLMQALFLSEFLPMLRPLRLPVMLETNGILHKKLAHIRKWIDIIAMDIKLPSALDDKNYWKEHAKFLRIAVEKDVFVKVIVNRKTADMEFKKAVEITGKTSAKIPFYIQPATPMDIKTGRLLKLYMMAAKCLRNVYVMPQMHAGKFY